MSRKNESVAWKVFVKVGGNKVVCRICGKQMNYQSGSSTSNMMKHLQAVHKQILAESPSIVRHAIKTTTTTAVPTSTPETDDQTQPKAPAAQVAAMTDPWVKIQQAPADLRQRWQDLKQGLHKEMRQHQQAVAWSAIGAPCLGAPAGADLLTDSQPSSQWSGGSCSEPNAEWRVQEGDVTCQLTEPFSVGIKAEPIETDDIEPCSPTGPLSPMPLAMTSPSPPLSSQIVSKSPDLSSSSRKSVSSQTSPEDEQCSAVEVELRLAGLRRAQQRAEEIHQEQLRESRARADAAQAERDHRLQLIRHAEELHQLQLEQGKQLHEITLKQAALHAEEQLAESIRMSS